MVDLKKKYILLSFILSVCNAYSIDGTMDRSFAMGQSYEQLPICKSVASQSDGKILVGGYVEAFGKKTFAVARLLQNGMLDQSFGKNGVVVTTFANGETSSSAQALMVDTAGRIVAAGFTNGIQNVCHACLARYNADGTLDKSFFGGRGVFKGTVITTFGSLEEISHINGLVETTDQKIIAVGATCQNNAVRFAIARYDINGTLDESFNSKGIVCTQIDSSAHDEAYAVAIDAYGKIVVGGSSLASGIKTFALARYHKDGLLDQSFFGGNSATHGMVITNFMCGETEGAIRAIRIQADGKILAGGYTNAFCGGQNSHFALARYTAQGMLDPHFGSSSSVPGTLVTNFGNEKARSCVNALLIQTDNKIVAGGFAEFNKTKYFALARYENNGSCDYTFNGGGAPSGKVLSRSSVNASDEIFGLVLAAPGDIVAVGRSKNDAMCYGAIARYICDQDMNAPEILVPGNNEIIANGAQVRVKGRAQDSSRVQMYLDDKLIDTIYVKRNNCWDCKLPSLPDGNHTLQVIERYDAGNVIAMSKKIMITIDQHPQAINQSIECQGMRPMQSSLIARGASGDYTYRITQENNCKVTLLDAGIYTLKATIPHGTASFEFEVQDKLTQFIAKGLVEILVREIPTAGFATLDTAQDKPLHGNLETFIFGGQKPYAFEVMNNNNGMCVVNEDGSFVFNPKPEFVGLSGFEFLATDTHKVASELAHVMIQVHSLPQAQEYKLSEFANTQIVGQVHSLAAMGRKPYKYVILPTQDHCAVSMEENGTFTCIPEKDYCGCISFEYTIVDARGYESRPCKVTINLHEILDLNEPYLIGIKNKTVKKNLNRFVSKGSKPYIFNLDTGTNHGTLNVTQDGVLEFIPNQDFVGNVEFAVLIGQSEAPENIKQTMKVAVTVKDITEFPVTSVNLHDGQTHGNLNLNAIQSDKYTLLHAPEGLEVSLHSDGSFVFQPKDEYKDSIEFLYKARDLNGLSEIKRAVIVYYKKPEAKSSNQEIIENTELLTGTISDLISGGIAPLTYKIVSETNGKAELLSDGTYIFKPQFDLSENAEFSFIILDSNNAASNVGTLAFHLTPQPIVDVIAEHAAVEPEIVANEEFVHIPETPAIEEQIFVEAKIVTNEESVQILEVQVTEALASVEPEVVTNEDLQPAVQEQEQITIEPLVVVNEEASQLENVSRIYKVIHSMNK